MRRLPSTNMVTSKLTMGLFSNLVSQQRALFSQTRIALPCRVDDDCHRDMSQEKVSDMEKQLCQARSVLAKTWFLIRDTNVKIPPQLTNQIIQELALQRKHRKEDIECETEKTMQDLGRVDREIERCKEEIERLQALQEKKTGLEKSLKALKEEDPNSDAFLDRDTSAYRAAPGSTY